MMFVVFCAIYFFMAVVVMAILIDSFSDHASAGEFEFIMGCIWPVTIVLFFGIGLGCYISKLIKRIGSWDI